VIRLAPNSPNQSWMLANAHHYDRNIAIEYLTLDGNATKQSKKTDGQHGLIFVGVQNAVVRGVVFKNLYGLSSGRSGPSGTSAENFHTDCKGCSDIIYSECRVESDPGAPCGSGFSLNGSSRVIYANCTVTGVSHGQGYTHWQSSDINYVNCHAYGCGADGFHSEHSDMVTYTACFSGASWQASQSSIQHKKLAKGNAIGFNIYYGTHVQIV